MGIFDSPQEKEFYRLRRIVIKRLQTEYFAEQNPGRQSMIEAMAKSVAFTPVQVFSDRQVLHEGVERKGNIFSFFQVKGETLVSFMETITGNKREVFVQSKIQMPELWEGGRFIPERLMTLFHEFGHNAELYMPAKLQGKNETQREQLADTLAVFTAKKLGFPEEVIKQSLRGREPFIGLKYKGKLVEFAKKKEGPPKRARARRPFRVIPFKPPEPRSISVRGKTRPIWALGRKRVA